MKWLLIGAGVVLLGLFVLALGKFGNPFKAARLHLDALKARAKARRLLVNQSASKVRRQLEAEHKETIERLDSEQKKRVETLANDPVALASLLVKFGKGN
jgi:hypothetical protein